MTATLEILGYLMIQTARSTMSALDAIPLAAGVIVAHVHLNQEKVPG